MFNIVHLKPHVEWSWKNVRLIFVVFCYFPFYLFYYGYVYLFLNPMLAVNGSLMVFWLEWDSILMPNEDSRTTHKFISNHVWHHLKISITIKFFFHYGCSNAKKKIGNSDEYLFNFRISLDRLLLSRIRFILFIIISACSHNMGWYILHYIW